ncbi:MAG: FAD-dependent oxidoreductase [Deltaproteobacteria bacterium]
MALFPKPERLVYIDVPARRAIDAGETDVLVVGSGCAGLAAAWAAAQSGVDVTLAERGGFLGGDATISLVTVLMSYRSQRPLFPEKGRVHLLPRDAGGKPAVEGFFRVLVERLVKAGGAIPPSEETGYTLSIDPEIYKLVTLELMQEAGVKLFLYANAFAVLGGGFVSGVVFDTKSGPVAIRAKAVVDCTGDGDICALAGAPFELGRESDHFTQPLTLFFLIDGFDREGFAGYVREHPDQWMDVYGLWDLIRKAEEAGDLKMCRENILMFGMPHRDKILVDSTRVIKSNGTDAWDLTRAAVESQMQLKELAFFLRKYVPGFERSRVDQSAPELYVRESRRITGDYVLTADDVLSGRTFDDVVARGAYCIDLHNPAGKGTLVLHLPPDSVYDIPLRCLIPRDTENLLVADRAISGTHMALASYRIEAIGSATGQAAGVCAALAVKEGKSPRQVDIRDIQRVLLEQGADLGHTGPAAKNRVFPPSYLP